MLFFLRFVVRVQRSVCPRLVSACPRHIGISTKHSSSPQAGTSTELKQGLATQQDEDVYSLLSYHSDSSLLLAMKTNKPSDN